MGNAGGLVGVSPKIFEFQVLYSVYFPFSEQFFESIYDVKSTNIYFHCHIGRVYQQKAGQINADGSPQTFTKIFNPQ